MYPKTPPTLISWLSNRTRNESIHQHAVPVGLDWWNEGRNGLPGLPVSAKESTTGRPRLSRGEIFSLGEAITTDRDGTAALRLMWHTLAWGTGPKQRGNARRVAAIRADIEGHTVLLTNAALMSRTDPRSAFDLFRVRGRNVVHSLGPNFFTKYLYFAGGGHPEHPCAIVDGRVRSTLYQVSEKTDRRYAPRSQYSVNDYEAALGCMRAWADDASSALDRPVALDEVERWAFGR